MRWVASRWKPESRLAWASCPLDPAADEDGMVVEAVVVAVWGVLVLA